MTLAEIIEAIKKLSPEERRELERFVFSDEMLLKEEPVAGRVAGKADSGVVTDEFRRMADRIFSENDELFRKLAR